jgi:pimeloyl-ACP methyl ester carboxylesterase
LIRALVLAEPPAIPLLQHLSGGDAAQGRALYAGIQRRMLIPMKADFARGLREAGVADFIDDVFNNPRAWQKMPADARSDTLRDAHEWDVMMTTGTLFPPISPEQIRTVHVPVLIMSGAKLYPFLALVDRELARLIPGARNITYAKSGHQMWYQQPEDCRRDAEQFFAAHQG